MIQTKTQKSYKIFVNGLLFLAILFALIGTTSQSEPIPAHAAGEIGYKSIPYGTAVSPTAEKPQSKLWFNNGIWWGCLYNKDMLQYEIFQFDWNTQSWSSTGTLVDTRIDSSADALWQGGKLYIASAVPPGASGDTSIQVRRYSYNVQTKTYSLDGGFPVTVANTGVEAVVIARDTKGKLWLTYTNDNQNGGRSVYITRSTSSDTTWQTPSVLPVTGADNLNIDDISAVVAYNKHIGVMWSNQTDGAIYFAYHNDGSSDSNWVLKPALQGPRYADDHINLKALQADAAGQVFAVVKTSLEDIIPPPANEPLVLLLTLDNNGAWTRRTFSRVQDHHTRPIVLLDEQNRFVYIFATLRLPDPVTGLLQFTGAIYYKKASLDNPSVQFPEGSGTPFILMATAQDNHINNASSTKQPLNSSTDLLVIAGNDTTKHYYHNTLELLPLDRFVYLPLIAYNSVTADAALSAR